MPVNTSLLNLIDERVKKILSKFKILKYKNALVQSVNEDTATVKFNDNTTMELPNLSGNFVLPDTDVLVYYWGNTISKNTAYIGKNATSVSVCNSGEYHSKENVLYFLKDTGEIYIGDTKYGGADIVIDSELSETSENPVQNKVITLKLKEFDSMFAEIKKLLEEIKSLIGGTSEITLYGLVSADLTGLDSGISGDLITESEV